ncbi:MAG: dethiobiotin synthase [Magnetococcales bacterium]|nr:dethiobiotin synthase [Magnetococcales bacterium]
MNIDPPERGLFVTGTDTGVGKSVASAWLAQKWSAAYWKPVQSGLEEESDSDFVRRLSGAPVFPERHRLTQPLSPHEAARRDGVRISLDDFSLPTGKKTLIVEGAGGVLVPLNDQARMVDLMVRLGLPVLLVARTALGTINHSLMSLECLRARGLEVWGAILSGPPDTVNREAIARFGGVRILAEIPRLEPLTRISLSAIPFCGEAP